MSVPAGISAIGSYVPPARLAVRALRANWPGVAAPGGVSTVSVPGFDEDAVTLGVEAADCALGAGGVEASSVELLAFATCSAPYLEHSPAVEVARALGLPRACEVVDLAGSTIGGVAALRLAHDAVAGGRVRRALVVAADQRRGAPGSAIEALGAGAAAAIVEADGPLRLLRFAAWRHGVPTRWRPDGDVSLRSFDDSRYELYEQVLPALEAALGEIALADPAFCALGPLDVRSLGALARSLKLACPTGTEEVAGVGDLGAAAALLALANCLSPAGGAGQGVAPGSEGLVVALEPGSGALACAAELVAPVAVRHSRPPTAEVGYVEFLKRYRALAGPAGPEPIVPYASSPSAARDDLDGSLAGARCAACNSLNVPPREVCIDCGGGDLSIERAARRGRVVTWNEQHIVAVSPEPPPVSVGVLRLDGEGGERGGQVSAMFCDTPSERLASGLPVELVYRRLGLEDGVVKYGWKARALDGRAGDGEVR